MLSPVAEPRCPIRKFVTQKRLNLIQHDHPFVDGNRRKSCLVLKCFVICSILHFLESPRMTEIFLLKKKQLTAKGNV